MKVVKTKQFQSYIMVLFFLLLIEVIFSILNKTSIFNISFLKIFLLINILSIIVGFLSSLLKGKATYIVNLIVIFGFTIYSWLQTGFYNFLGVFISVNTSGQFGAVKSYVKDFLASIKMVHYLLFLPFIIALILMIVSFKLNGKSNKFSLKVRYRYQKTILALISGIAIIISCGGFYELLNDKYSSDSYQAVSNKDLFLSASNPGLYVKEYGVISYLFSDLYSKNYSKNDDNIVYFAYNNEDVQREFDDEAWEVLIKEENNEIYNNLNNYFINNKITDVNEYTGMFEDKNLIVIMLESVNDIIYNKEYFPNFYKLANEGWYFNNNYSPRNSCATGNNEFSALTGLYSIYNDCTTNTYAFNTYNGALFNIFNNNGYYTDSFHNYNERYYYRETYHPNMGSQKYYGVDTLGIDYSYIYGEWSSDVDLMNKYLESLDQNNNEKFMSFITTVTSHQPYVTDSFYGNLHLDMTEDTNYSLEVRRYLSKLKVVDDALGVLVDGLEQRGLLEDTVIVMFGDHYPYGLTDDNLSEVLDRSLEDYDNEKVPLVIYNPEMKAKKQKIYTSYINLTPTLANLFGLDYDPRLYTGMDIFDKDYNNTVAFPDSSWKNDKAFYDATTGSIKYYKKDTYTDEEIKNMNTYFYSKMNASEVAIRYNYFNYLKTNLDIINERNMEN